MRHFYLYSTLGCHLCDEAEALLVPLLAPGVEIDIIDIAEENLIDRYGMRIPVLRNELTGEELDWPFDSERLRWWLLG